MAKIYKRGEVWWARVSYRGQDCRKSLETASARIAGERLLTFIADVKAGNWTGDKPRRKFDDAANRFIDEHFPRLRPNSRKRYRVSLMNLLDHMRVAFLDEIGSAVLSNFEVARRKQGVTDGTIRRDLMCLSSLFSCARDWEWVTENPAGTYLRQAKRRGFVEAPPRTRFFNHAEEKAILAYCVEKLAAAKGNRDLHAWRMQLAAFTFAIDTGLRAEEIFTLAWPQINFDAKQVTVHREQAKGKRTRFVPIFERSLALLSALPRSKHSDFVFWHRDGRRYSHMYVQLVRACEALKILDVEFHDLRRTCGVRLIRDHGMRMESISLWLGHNNIGITEKIYAFLDVDDLHKAIADSPVTQRKAAQFSAQAET